MVILHKPADFPNISGWFLNQTTNCLHLLVIQYLLYAESERKYPIFSTNVCMNSCCWIFHSKSNTVVPRNWGTKVLSLPRICCYHSHNAHALMCHLRHKASNTCMSIFLLQHSTGRTETARKVKSSRKNNNFVEYEHKQSGDYSVFPFSLKSLSQFI